MKPEWVVQSATRWALHGRVDFADAPELAAAFEPEAEHSCRVDLQMTCGGTPLLLVLLACVRKAGSVSARLELENANEGLQRLMTLSDLEALLPLK